jgi:hypothetical protein
MDAFGDDLDFTSVPAAGETIPQSDPAADFLAREQAELGEDLGQELGLDSAATTSPPQVVIDEVPSTYDTDTINSEIENMGIGSGEGRSSPRFIMPSRPKEEPETIRKWREEQEMRLKEKDETEQIRMDELREQAKKELDDWYKHRVPSLPVLLIHPFGFAQFRLSSRFLLFICYFCVVFIGQTNSRLIKYLKVTLPYKHLRHNGRIWR